MTQQQPPRTYEAVLDAMKGRKEAMLPQPKQEPTPEPEEPHGMTSMRAAIASVKIPDAMFTRMGGKATLAEVKQTCDVCGASVKPLIVKNGYLPGECQCKRDRREAQARTAIRNELVEREMNRRRAECAKCYTWLDEHEVGLDAYTFENFQQELQPEAYTKMYQFATRQDENGKPLLRGNYLLLGDYGTGKTMLASAVCNYLSSLLVPCRFMTAQSFFEAIYASYKSTQNEESAQDLLKEASEAQVLVIDDLDKLHLPKSSDGEYFQHKMLFEVLDKRYKRGLPTIITTNSEDVTRYIGGASFSRLKRGLVTVPMFGEDFRDTMIEGLG